jgi:hypothetical protein
MTLRRRFAALAAVILAAMAAVMPGGAAPGDGDTAAGGQPRTRRFNLGVMRADGVLMPFASFDGDDWKASWPTSLIARDLPASLADVPSDWWGGVEPSQWRLLSHDNEPALPFKPIATTMIVVGGERRLALRTDRPAAAVKALPFEVPFPKAGLAVSGDVEIKPILTISRLGPAAPQLLQAVTEELNAAEERTLSALRGDTGWKHPLDKAARARVAPELEAWYGTPLVEPGVRVSYIEAVKKYPPQPKDEGCGLETFVTGWIHHNDRQNRARTQLKATVVYCDRVTASYMLPFGQVEVRDRTHWIYQMSGRDHEWFVVAELAPTRTRIVAEYFAGGVPR